MEWADRARHKETCLCETGRFPRHFEAAVRGITVADHAIRTLHRGEARARKHLYVMASLVSTVHVSGVRTNGSNSSITAYIYIVEISYYLCCYR